jgi:hypothetical protein
MDQVVIAGNASLALMHDTIVFALIYGTRGNPPWLNNKPITFYVQSQAMTGILQS